MGNRKLEKDAEGGQRSRGRKAVFMVVEKSSTATVHAPSPIKRLVNPGGQTPRLRLLNELN